MSLHKPTQEINIDKQYDKLEDDRRFNQAEEKVRGIRRYALSR